MLQRYKLLIEYKGDGYCGWQKQPGFISIEQTIKNALFKLTKINVEIFASGRTDAGVHAKEQVAHIDLPINIEFSPHKLSCGLNYFLQGSNISIIKSCFVPMSFHARFNAKKRHYRYYIVNRYANLALLENMAWLIRPILNIEAMSNATKYFLGYHDLTSFRDKKCQAKDPRKTIEKMSVNNINDEIIEIKISSISFLHHQVRNMVGTLYLVGKGTIKPHNIKDIIEAKNRAKAGPTAPAYGLYLWQVDY